jgi:hypothetical protein
VALSKLRNLTNLTFRIHRDCTINLADSRGSITGKKTRGSVYKVLGISHRLPLADRDAQHEQLAQLWHGWSRRRSRGCYDDRYRWRGTLAIEASKEPLGHTQCSCWIGLSWTGVGALACIGS